MENSTELPNIGNEELLDYDDSYSEYEHYMWISYATAFSELIKILFLLAMLGINCYLIFVILKFEKLKTRTNYLLLNYIIWSNVHYILEIVFTLIIFLSYYPLIFHICVIMLVKHVALICSFMFLQLILFEWLLIRHFENSRFLSWYKKCIKFTIPAVYLIGMGKISLSVNTCKYLDQIDSFFVGALAIYVLYILTLIFLLVIYVINRVKQKDPASRLSRKTQYAFTVSSYAILLWIPMFVYQVVLFSVSISIHYDYYWIARLLFFLKWVPHFVPLSNPVVMLCLLKKHNNDFKMAFDTLFKKSVRNYENENLDDDSEDEERTVKLEVAKDGHLTVDILKNKKNNSRCYPTNLSESMEYLAERYNNPTDQYFA